MVLKVNLFGKLCVWRDDRVMESLVNRKAEELFCYLLLYRDRPHHRETLAGTLWGESTDFQAKKYLRQSLWQLQSALNPQRKALNDRLFTVDQEWIELCSQPDLWLDVAFFEQVFHTIQGVPGDRLGPLEARALETAVNIYRGDLLEGWYQAWCLAERERFQDLYLLMLGKLIAYCEAHAAWETGMSYSRRILNVNRAHERTHRQLMRLYYQAGDRAAALRQYERCADVLQEELGVEPAKSTQALYQQIRADRVEGVQWTESPKPALPKEPGSMLPEVIACMEQFHQTLLGFQVEIQKEIEVLQKLMKRQG